MLSETEQRRLAAMESRLLAEDPEFVARFTLPATGARAGGWRGPAALAAFLATVTAAGLGLFALAAFIVVIAAICTVRLWALHWLDRSTG